MAYAIARHPEWQDRLRDECSSLGVARLGYPVEWKTYPMAHAVCPDEVAHVRTWLGRIYLAERAGLTS